MDCLTTALPTPQEASINMTYAADAPSDSPVNYALIAIAQEVAELLKQSYPVQADEIDGIG
ncbi:hypothetical protein PGN35_010230 [Nodosilinea sp. PGN35]|uniref:hypothetical protein n=1 Tax=Nodosilinea sp. PGN35 TaxID=3020489 RepID=UPI0023B2C37A|nr:hypothetical protein [Nodosilinea sp. TSF1-S3]MDF0366594.1 hypothetical protein [Nodosilinea sp. TSF1-S3]